MRESNINLESCTSCYDIIDSNKIGFKLFYVIIAVKYTLHKLKLLCFTCYRWSNTKIDRFTIFHIPIIRIQFISKSFSAISERVVLRIIKLCPKHVGDIFGRK